MRFRNRSAAARYSANARWRAVEARAQAERDAGIPDREPIIDTRQCIDIDLTSHGGPRLRIEPRVGYVSCRMVNLDTGSVECAALKTLLHTLADNLPRRMGMRNCA